MNEAQKRQFFEMIESMNVTGIRELKESIMPRKFYKYYRFNKYALLSLTGDYLFMSSPLMLNDPFDTQVGYLSSIENNPNQRRFNNNINRNVRTCSLSEVNDSILMWSHYAFGHTGFCVEYDLSGMDEAEMITFYPVYYTDQIFNLEPYEHTRDKMDICIMASLLKHKDWSYEREWRFFDMGMFGGQNVSVPKPTAIFLGAKFNQFDPDQQIQEFQSSLFEYVRNNNIPLYGMEPRPDRFALSTFELDVDEILR